MLFLRSMKQAVLTIKSIFKTAIILLAGIIVIISPKKRAANI